MYLYHLDSLLCERLRFGLATISSNTAQLIDLGESRMLEEVANELSSLLARGAVDGEELSFHVCSN